MLKICNFFPIENCLPIYIIILSSNGKPPFSGLRNGETKKCVFSAVLVFKGGDYFI